MKRLVQLTLLLGLCLGLSGLAQAQQIVWRMGHVPAPDSSYLVTLETVPARFAKATHGRLKVELYSSLVPGPQQPAAMRDGRLDMIAGVNPWLSGEAPILNAGHLPGLIADVPEYKKVLDAYLAGEYAKVWDSKYNGKLIMSGVFERQVILSNKPLRRVEDFKGLKIRVHNAEAAQLMNAIGAKPTAVTFTEIAPALQRGVVDAVMTSCGTSYGMGFYNVAKYINIWKIGTAVGWSLVVNNDAWKKLPADMQKEIQEEARKIEEQHFAEYNSYSDHMIELQVQKGMTLIQPPQSEIDRMFAPKNVKAVYDAWYALNEKNGFDGRRVEQRVRQILGK
jgi:TRAP-type C4-dicarboxylate transport system substrate-binding protein